MKKIKYLILLLVLTSTNLFSKDIQILSDIPGNGIEIKKHYKVHVNYIGTLENGSEFDNSIKRKEPFIFQIGLKQVIPGWEMGIIGMKIGGKRTIKIPPELAYGSNGVGDLIPPNSTLIFQIEIINAFEPGYKLISSSELSIKNKEDLIIIDIRSKKEINNTGIIKDSITITAFDINGNFNKNFLKVFQSIASTDDKILFISDDGEISSVLANGFVEQLKYKFVYSLDGGIKKWINDGNKVFK